MKYASNLAKIVGFAIRYAPIIMTIVTALKMIQDKLEELKTNEENK